MRTYWLLGKIGDRKESDVDSDTSATLDVDAYPNHEKSLSLSVLYRPSQEDSIGQSNGDLDNHHRVSESELPDEITTIESPTYSGALSYPMPGRPTKRTWNGSTDKQNDIPPISEIKVEPPAPTTDEDNNTILQTTPM